MSGPAENPASGRGCTESSRPQQGQAELNSRRAAPQATSKSHSREDARGTAVSPARGLQAPAAPSPAPTACHPRAAPAQHHCKAAALCVSIPCRAASAGLLRHQHPQGHHTDPSGPATGSPAARGAGLPCSSHLPEGKSEAAAHFTLQLHE